MKSFYRQKIAIILVILGSLNWGLTALNFNVVQLLNVQANRLFNSDVPLDKIIYLIIAVASFELMKRDVFLPFLGKTVIPPSVIPLKINKYQNNSVKINVKPNSKVIYWAAKKLDSNNHPVSQAYGDYSNSGVVMSDKNGIAILKLQKGSGYVVPWGNKQIPPHVHYRVELKPGKLSRIETIYY